MAQRKRPSDASDAGRRRFLTIGVGGLGSALVAATFGPAIVSIAYPIRHATTSGGDAFVPVGRPDRFTEGNPVKVELYAERIDAYDRFEHQKLGSAWVVRREGVLVALSTVCPHLGCAVDWAPRAGCFECPCHRSTFSIDGKRRSGPSPRDMDRLDVVEKGDRVEVRHRRFRQGIAEKVPV